MNLDKIKACFNKASGSYDDFNEIQIQAGMHLIASLEATGLLHPVKSTGFAMTSPLSLRAQRSNPAFNIIDLGCGTGAITEQLARTVTYTTFHAIDIAEKSLTIANDRLLPFGIKTRLRNFDSIYLFNIKFDLAFANMSLQWSDNLENTIRHISSQLTPNGILAFSIPLTKTFNELKNNFSINQFYHLEYIKNLLLKLNFSLEYIYSENKLAQFDSTLSALKSIKQVGANATQHPKIKSLRTLSSLPTNITSLTYHIGYFIARKNGEITS